MKYDFKCEECSTVEEVEMKPDRFRDVKDEGLPCQKCDEGTAYNVFNPGDIQVCYEGFQWADKNYREKAYRKNRSKKMQKRQDKHNWKPELVANYKGERTKNWKEAYEAAKSDPDNHNPEQFLPKVVAEEKEEKS